MTSLSEYEANVAARLERERLVPHVANCDDEGCYCPDDVLWARLLGDDDPCAPGKDWAAAAFTEGPIDLTTHPAEKPERGAE